MPKDAMNEYNVNRRWHGRVKYFCQAIRIDPILRLDFGSVRNDDECFKFLTFLFNLAFNVSLSNYILAAFSKHLRWVLTETLPSSRG